MTSFTYSRLNLFNNSITSITRSILACRLKHQLHRIFSPFHQLHFYRLFQVPIFETMKQQIITLLHIGYWSFYLGMLLVLFLTAQIGQFTQLNFSYIIGVVCSFIVLPAVLGFYLSYFFLFKKYLRQRKLGRLFSYGFVGIVLIALSSGGVASIVFGSDFMFKDGYTSFFSELLLLIIIGFINGIAGFILKGFISWYAELKIKEALQQYTDRMELELIKSKLNPHFLFNSINNIDGLMRRDVEVASNYLDKLAAMLRFMLYESKEEKIGIARELAYIQQYIDLQKIRTTNTDFVKYIVTGEQFKHRIPPMLFIPFIENAFKHVISKKAFHAIAIHISISTSHQLIRYFMSAFFRYIPFKNKSVAELCTYF